MVAFALGSARAYFEETGDVAFVRERFGALADVLDSYRERYARPDGLVHNLDKWCVVEWPMNFQDGYDAKVGTRTFEGWGKDTKWNTSLFHLTAASAVLFLCDSGIERTIAF